MSDTSAIKDGARRLMEARAAKDEADTALENAKREFRDTEADFYELLEESDVVGTLKLDLGEPWGVVSFLNQETFYGRIIDDEAAVEHYEGRAMIDEMTAPKFVMRRVNEEVRDAMERGAKLPPGVDWYAKRFVRVTRPKS